VNNKVNKYGSCTKRVVMRHKQKEQKFEPVGTNGHNERKKDRSYTEH
jgi:hypothetical protein